MNTNPVISSDLNPNPSPNPNLLPSPVGRRCRAAQKSAPPQPQIQQTLRSGFKYFRGFLTLKFRQILPGCRRMFKSCKFKIGWLGKLQLWLASPESWTPYRKGITRTPTLLDGPIIGSGFLRYRMPGPFDGPIVGSKSPASAICGGIGYTLFSELRKRVSSPFKTLVLGGRKGALTTTTSHLSADSTVALCKPAFHSGASNMEPNSKYQPPPSSFESLQTKRRLHWLDFTCSDWPNPNVTNSLFLAGCSAGYVRFVPLDSSQTKASANVIGCLRGSFIAILAAVCLATQISWAANTLPVTISTNMPAIKIHQPISDFKFRFIAEASTGLARCPFLVASSASFSIQRPRNTIMPPTLATTGIMTDQEDHQNAKKEPTTTQIVIIAAIPIIGLVIIFIAFAIRFRPGRR